MKKLLTILAALAILASGTVNAQVAEKLTAHRLDRPWTFSSFVAPSGCVSSSVPFFGASVTLGCDAGITYDATNKRLKINGGGTGAESIYRLQVAMGPSPGYGFTVSNGTIDPWFHINSFGVGLVGNGTTIPFLAIESDTTIKRQLRSTITADSADPGGYATLWAMTTDHAASPMGLFLRADKDIILQAGTSNAVTNNISAVKIAGSAGVSIGEWPAGTGWIDTTSTGSLFGVPIRFPDGTAAAPGLGLGSATTSGFYAVGSGSIGMAISGSAKTVFTSTDTYTAVTYRPGAADSIDLGNTSYLWRTLLLQRAALGSKSKALTDGSPVTFATFTIADAAMYSGEIIYNVKAAKGTDRQVLASKVRFTAARVGTNYYVGISEVGSATTAVSTGTLSCPITISGTGGVISLVATADTSFASPDSLVGQFRFDSPDAALALTFP